MERRVSTRREISAERAVSDVFESVFSGCRVSAFWNQPFPVAMDEQVSHPSPTMNEPKSGVYELKKICCSREANP